MVLKLSILRVLQSSFLRFIPDFIQKSPLKHNASGDQIGSGTAYFQFSGTVTGTVSGILRVVDTLLDRVPFSALHFQHWFPSAFFLSKMA